MMDDFTTAEIYTGETSIFVRSYGSGPPIRAACVCDSCKRVVSTTKDAGLEEAP